jgi:hypothetical protein
LPTVRQPFTLRSAVSNLGLLFGPPPGEHLRFRRDNCNFCLCQPSNLQSRKRSTPTSR